MPPGDMNDTARKYATPEDGPTEPTEGTTFVMAKVRTTGPVPDATTLLMVSTLAGPTIHSCSTADSMKVILPMNASSVIVVAPAPFATVKSLNDAGAVKVIVRLSPIQTLPSKTAIEVPSCVASITVYVVPSHEE